MTFSSQSVDVFILNKKVNFVKNETESKMENPRRAFR